jgi:Na+/phosphate symporter
VPKPTVPPTTVRLAALITAVEGVALFGLGVFYLVKTAVQRPDSYGRALFGTAFALLGGALLVLLARGLDHLDGWARTPTVLLQLLALPVGYSLGIQAGLIGYGGPILVAAVGVLYLLFTPEARSAFWD